MNNSKTKLILTVLKFHFFCSTRTARQHQSQYRFGLSTGGHLQAETLPPRIADVCVNSFLVCIMFWLDIIQRTTICVFVICYNRKNALQIVSFTILYEQLKMFF